MCLIVDLLLRSFSYCQTFLFDGRMLLDRFRVTIDDIPVSEIAAKFEQVRTGRSFDVTSLSGGAKGAPSTTEAPASSSSASTKITAMMMMASGASSNFSQGVSPRPLPPSQKVQPFRPLGINLQQVLFFCSPFDLVSAFVFFQHMRGNLWYDLYSSFCSTRRKTRLLIGLWTPESLSPSLAQRIEISINNNNNNNNNNSNNHLL